MRSPNKIFKYYNTTIFGVKIKKSKNLLHIDSFSDSGLFERPVKIHTDKESNPHFCETVLSEAEVLYEQA